MAATDGGQKTVADLKVPASLKSQINFYGTTVGWTYSGWVHGRVGWETGQGAGNIACVVTLLFPALCQLSYVIT